MSAPNESNEVNFHPTLPDFQGLGSQLRALALVALLPSAISTDPSNQVGAQPEAAQRENFPEALFLPYAPAADCQPNDRLINFRRTTEGVQYLWSFEKPGNTSIAFSLYIDLPKSALREYAELDHTHGRYIQNIEQEPNLDKVFIIAQRIKAVADANEIDPARLALSFVQSIEYRSPGAYQQYPGETLLNGWGDCSDKSVLFSALVAFMGYDTVFLNYDENEKHGGHLAVGINSNKFSGTYFEHNGEKYYFCETTCMGWEIGQLPGDFDDEGAKVTKCSFTLEQNLSLRSYYNLDFERSLEPDGVDILASTPLGKDIELAQIKAGSSSRVETIKELHSGSTDAVVSEESDPLWMKIISELLAQGLVDSEANFNLTLAIAAESSVDELLSILSNDSVRRSVSSDTLPAISQQASHYLLIGYDLTKHGRTAAEAMGLLLNRELWAAPGWSQLLKDGFYNLESINDEWGLDKYPSVEALSHEIDDAAAKTSLDGELLSFIRKFAVDLYNAYTHLAEAREELIDRGGEF